MRRPRGRPGQSVEVDVRQFNVGRLMWWSPTTLTRWWMPKLFKGADENCNPSIAAILPPFGALILFWARPAAHRPVCGVRQVRRTGLGRGQARIAQWTERLATNQEVSQVRVLLRVRGARPQEG